ncbi:helix-hairpin-helix domain-containing protein [Chitinophaga lutea]|uniref:helix-hairpin-helix domain-containing protein n=1 Tax=Chitinophaga lutea TaxID=2488634 RepID=UPI000F4EAEE3|nr:helix-hairpin-helix domain-containing protein [Chitinophaga lutea]
MPNKTLREFFDFSRRERTGIACLLILIVLIYCLPYGWGYLSEGRARSDTAGFHEAALAVDNMMRKDSAALARRRKNSYDSSRYRYRKYAFNRDHDRYRNGQYAYGRGRWHDARDSARYGYWSGYRKYERGRPYVSDSSRSIGRERSPGKTIPFRKPLLIDINAADSAQWERLPLIGPVLAQRIVRFRERLGGFHEVAQVGETYGLADSVFKKIQGMLVLGEVSLRKTDLNQTDEKSLADHPYINTKLARLIVRYRNNHGPFRHLNELRGIALVDDSIYRKLEKYLEVR